MYDERGNAIRLATSGETAPGSNPRRGANMSKPIDASQPFLSAPKADLEFLDAVRRIVPGWDGKNMEVPEELLRSLDFTPEEIKSMPMFKAQMKIALNAKKLREIFVTSPPRIPLGELNRGQSETSSGRPDQ